MARRIVDLSVALENDVPADPAMFRPRITDTDHHASMPQLQSLAVHAPYDLLPHRLAPLSVGQVDDEGVHCGYDGLKFGPGGACIANPHGPLLFALALRRYPLAERHKLIWVWIVATLAGEIVGYGALAA